MQFIEQLEATLGDPQDRPLFDFRGRTFMVGEAADIGRRCIALLDEARVPAAARISVVVRNRVLHASTMLGLIAGERSLTMFHALQSAAALTGEIGRSGFGAILIGIDDWTEEVAAATAAVGTAALLLRHDPEAPSNPFSRRGRQWRL